MLIRKIYCTIDTYYVTLTLSYKLPCFLVWTISWYKVRPLSRKHAGLFQINFNTSFGFNHLEDMQFIANKYMLLSYMKIMKQPIILYIGSSKKSQPMSLEDLEKHLDSRPERPAIEKATSSMPADIFGKTGRWVVQDTELSLHCFVWIFKSIF